MTKNCFTKPEPFKHFHRFLISAENFEKFLDSNKLRLVFAETLN